MQEYLSAQLSFEESAEDRERRFRAVRHVEGRPIEDYIKALQEQMDATLVNAEQQFEETRRRRLSSSSEAEGSMARRLVRTCPRARAWQGDWDA
jgi:hypothetical protein